MLKRLTPTSVRSTYKKDGKRTLVNGVAVSADGKTLSVAQSGVNAKGQTVKNNMVFDRQ
jgi:sugar lactone lactonase YvrE